MPEINISALDKKNQAQLKKLSNILGCSIEEAANHALETALNARLHIDIESGEVIPFPSRNPTK